ncbi:acetyl-CoA synthetase-like protein [Conidiobolus coronatus NRRL 28638]|uniref:Acetyl-CoA synthetase-like protein n=1 Tax=Conidiobolus coronatus (strain ATCC 28846 / CBS 209.66 / NRRL 28638) TaxID=796925 RepID=A0A137NVS6_CONC2|nr:acetyl-CoA synthetase-like protein [Conidiobolus coronatus NRRL 28638]|eukprot:KXN66857.1 acetyl-CoA synthetase-like protein [Conidiobolus coronatus NRRL 28638]
MTSVQYSSTGRFIDLVKENSKRGNSVQHPAISINSDGKYFDISYEEYYNIVSHSANHFYDQLKSIDFSAGRNVAFLSASDSHYLWNMLGLMATNVSPVLLSPRNSVEATIHLLKESNSRVLVYQDVFAPMAKGIQKAFPDLVILPKWITKYPECLSPVDHKLLIPLKSQEEELNTVSYTVHSSASTAYPKLVPQLNRVCHNVGYRARNEMLPYDRKELNFFPLFHAGGVMSIVIATNYLMKSTILGPDMTPGSFPSPKMIIELIQELSPKALVIIPLLAKVLVDYCEKAPRSEGWDTLKTVDFVRWGGAEVPKFAVQALFDNGVTPLNNIASTELSLVMSCVPDKNSEYLVPLTPAEGLQYTLKDWGNNIVELVISKDDPCLACVQEKDEDGNFPTKDLFQIISREPLLLSYYSRADDTIIHVNGEKTNPIPMEDTINRCPYIDACAILGTGKQLNTLLVQLKSDEVLKSSLNDVITSIKSFVKTANDSAPSHSRIYDEMIYYLPLNNDKKLPVTIKGNLQRSKCAIMFEEEVKQSVEKMESGNVSDETPGLEGKSSEEGGNTESIVKACLKSSIDKQLENSDSFFNNGMDSLSGMRFRNLLKSKISGLDLKVTDIYDNDTVDKLVEFIEFSKQGKKPNNKPLEDYQKEVDDYIARYIKSLVEQPKVSKVYALIRAKDDAQAKQKLESSFSQRFINISPENSTKIVPLAVKLHEDQLGLSNETYKLILPKLTHVHHVGWTMNFLKGLDYFDDCIAASKNLMKLSVLSRHKVIYNLVSTIGATFPTTSADVTSVPESSLSTKLLNAGTCNGYNLSKLVTETVSQIWSKDYDIPLHIHRVGQISGDTINGSWNITEHIPLLIKGIQVMKIFPDILESTLTWIPANTAADAIVEIGAQDQTSQNGIAHIINPNGYSFNIIYDTLKDYGIGFELVSVQEFIHQLKTNPEYQNADVNPLATLTDFFDTVFLSGHDIILETKLTSQSSTTISNCPALDGNLMTRYLKYWEKQDFIISN